MSYISDNETEATYDELYKWIELEIELLALEYTELKTLAEVSTGKAPGPESSILKIKGTEIQSCSRYHPV